MSSKIANLAKSANNNKNPIRLTVWGAIQEREMCLDFAVMPCLQLFQSLASSIVENVINCTGRKLKLFACFYGLLAGKLCR